MQFRRQSNGQPIVLDSSSEISAGGEARIYAVPNAPGMVAKIYHTSTDAHARKLSVMIANPPADPMLSQGHVSIAWPIDILQTADISRQTVGFLMPRAPGMRPIADFYNPKTRRQQCPLFNYLYLHRAACNLASSVHALHARGYVIGDVNESNILVTDTALVTLVDTDSFQVTDPQSGTIYRCPVGKLEFTPPELQSMQFDDIDRAPEHDRFGLAVLIFQMLMEGIHPYAGVFMGGGDPPAIAERISAGHFPYRNKKRIPYDPVPIAPPLEILHPSLRKLFMECFAKGHRRPRVRPHASVWQNALHKAEKSLVICSANDQHYYGKRLKSCPWCERAARLGGRDPFPSQQQAHRGQHFFAVAPTQIPLPSAQVTKSTSQSLSTTVVSQPRSSIVLRKLWCYWRAGMLRFVRWSVSRHGRRIVPVVSLLLIFWLLYSHGALSDLGPRVMPTVTSLIRSRLSRMSQLVEQTGFYRETQPQTHPSGGIQPAGHEANRQEEVNKEASKPKHAFPSEDIPLSEDVQPDLNPQQAQPSIDPEQETVLLNAEEDTIVEPSAVEEIMTLIQSKSPGSQPPLRSGLYPSADLVKERRNPKDGAIMMYVPEGEFIMGLSGEQITSLLEGDPRRQRWWFGDPKPQRSVFLGDYWIYRYEVTVAQYRRFCQETDREMPPPPWWGWKDEHPIVNVTWYEAAAYCEWAGGRLPTEAQWEKAARGTDGRVWPWGNDWDSQRCNSRATGIGKSSSIGNYPLGSSPYGVMDMAGNVWEWCTPGTTGGSRRALRGGSWSSNPNSVRVVDRRLTRPDNRYLHGFRCVGQMEPRQ